jgi:chemotaxis response regulator CheB
VVGRVVKTLAQLPSGVPHLFRQLFGLPDEAIVRQAIDDVLPLDQIAGHVTTLLPTRSHSSD